MPDGHTIVPTNLLKKAGIKYAVPCQFCPYSNVQNQGMAKCIGEFRCPDSRADRVIVPNKFLPQLVAARMDDE